MNNKFLKILTFTFFILLIFTPRIYAADSGSIAVTVTITEVIPQAGVTIRVVPKSRRVRASDTVSLRATIRNMGDGNDSFVLTAFSPLGWEVIFPQGDILGPIEPGARETVPVRIIVPLDAAKGDINTLIITATSQFDPLVSDSSLSTITIR